MKNKNGRIRKRDYTHIAEETKQEGRMEHSRRVRSVKNKITKLKTWK